MGADPFQEGQPPFLESLDSYELIASFNIDRIRRVLCSTGRQSLF